MQGFRKFPKAPDPESRENRNIAGGQKTSRFDCQYHTNFGGSFLYAARSNFSGASETKSAPILVPGIYSQLMPSSPWRFL
jgi:hypothetical protein